MAGKKSIQKGEMIGLKLTKAERSFLLEKLVLIPTEVKAAIESTSPTKPVMISLQDLDDLGDRLAEEANHTKDKKVKKTFDRISQKIDNPLDRNNDETESSGAVIHPADPLPTNEPTTLPISSKSKTGEDQFPIKLTDKQREALLHATRLRRGLKNRLEQSPAGTQIIGFTKKELNEMAEEAETALPFAPGPDKKQLLVVRDRIDDVLESLEEDERVKPSRTDVPKADRVYQLRITLRDISPPIWRRVQVTDCTLGNLHEVIQTVMGWKDCHLHQFIINGEYYGPLDPDDDYLGMEIKDEEGVLLSQIIRGDRKVRFRYEYDFGDEWLHEIVFERVVGREPRVKCPRCVDGARACPPEDVGGPLRYGNFLEAIADPSHENHEWMKEWFGGKFDPKRFDGEKVNRELRRIWAVLFPWERTS
jgi:hypothetical protein